MEQQLTDLEYSNTKPAITRPPDPADDNFIIHTRDHHDYRAIGRVREAAERRLRELERKR